MKSKYGTWSHPYEIAEEFSRRTAYFSMEFGVHQGLKIYSGGLGFLSGSHMRSAHDLKQNLVGIGMLWKYGYYDQGRNMDQSLRVDFIEKKYGFLEDSGIEVEVAIVGNPSVKVRAYVLRPETFQTAPIYLLSTDVQGNDPLSRSITDHLYDANEMTRIAQSIVLGIGGAKVLAALGGADVYHLNESHGLPAFYYLRNQAIEAKKVFTTHTPERAGNERREGNLLNDFGFFGRKLSKTELRKEMINGNTLNYTLAALRFSEKANAVSKLHAQVSNQIWENFENVADIIPITNSQNPAFWQDNDLKKALGNNDLAAFKNRKKELKNALFEEVLNQTGKIFDPEVATIVWARRFAGYKRADLLLLDSKRFESLITGQKYPVQIIWAGKPYPVDNYSIGQFNKLVAMTRDRANLAVLIGYEIDLSKKLKTGSDVRLNTPRITREASGTSGMTAAMNGSVNLSVNDGWIPEFGRDGENCFLLPQLDSSMPINLQDQIDCKNLYDVLEQKVLPTFYEHPDRWAQIAFNAINDVVPAFASERMARQYYEELY